MFALSGLTKGGLFVIMSYQMIEAIKPLQLPPTAKFVLYILADAHNAQTNLCHPGYAYLIQSTCLSNKTIANSLHLLKQRGVIDYDSKRGRNTTYKITPEALHSKSKFVKEVHNFSDDKVVKEVHISCEGGSHICEGGSQEPELTIKNHYINRSHSGNARGKRVKKSKEADPRFVPFRNAWVNAFKLSFENVYQFHKRDGVQLAEFLKHEQAMDLAEWEGFISWLHKSMKDNGRYALGIVKRSAGSLATACSSFNQLLVISQNEK